MRTSLPTYTQYRTCYVLGYLIHITKFLVQKKSNQIILVRHLTLIYWFYHSQSKPHPCLYPAWLGICCWAGLCKMKSFGFLFLPASLDPNIWAWMKWKWLKAQNLGSNFWKACWGFSPSFKARHASIKLESFRGSNYDVTLEQLFRPTGRKQLLLLQYSIYWDNSGQIPLF